MNPFAIPPAHEARDRAGDRLRIAADLEAFLAKKGNKIEVLPGVGGAALAKRDGFRYGRAYPKQSDDSTDEADDE